MQLFFMKHGVTKFSFSKLNQAEKKFLGQRTRASYHGMNTSWHSVEEKRSCQEKGFGHLILWLKRSKIYNTAS